MARECQEAIFSTGLYLNPAAVDCLRRWELFQLVRQLEFCRRAKPGAADAATRLHGNDERRDD
ncbi:MAG TPA: hypothetical protein VJP80_00625 [Candidatus Saccharimonadales bacterium]|nr:hypothetical protein [Candidatus Saccharimonadales bacterium]